MDKWSIWFFANGNNELEPQVWNSIKKLINCSDCIENEVIIQVARQNKVLTSVIKNRDVDYGVDEIWCGVRRYILNKKGFNLIEVLENKNMADSITLEEFLTWAKLHSTSNKIILILGGHIYQFVGMSPDFAGDNAYIFGFPEISDAINNVCNKLNFNIEILLLDTCYASTFEVISEFCRNRESKIKSILTYIGKGPNEGFPYEVIIDALYRFRGNSYTSLEDLIKTIIRLYEKVGCGNDLIGINLVNEYIERIKNDFSNIALKFLKNKEIYSWIEDLYQLFLIDKRSYPWDKEVIDIHYLTNKLVICKSDDYRKIKNNNLPIHVLYKFIPDSERRNLYSRLYFCRNNYWSNLVCNIAYSEKNEYQKIYLRKMTDNILQAFISNTNKDLDLNEQINIKGKIVKFSSWINNENIKGEALNISFIIPHVNLTGGLKMILQQMENLKNRGHKVYAVYKSDEDIDRIPLSWDKIYADKEIIVKTNECIKHKIPESDVIILGWFSQILDLKDINKPILYWEQGHEWLFGDIGEGYSKNNIELLMKVCYSSNMNILSVSSKVQELIYKKFNIKTNILSNGIDLNRYFPGEKYDEPTILLVGNPNLRFKGFEIALNALNLVWDLGYKFRVVWACQEINKNYAHKFPIKYYVRPEQKKLAQLYRKSMMIVYTSWYEGFGMPPLEAMASGTAVISTKCMGVDDFIIDNYNGCTVEVGDVKGVAARVILILTNPNIRKIIVENGLKTVKNHDYNNIITKLERIIYSLKEQNSN